MSRQSQSVLRMSRALGAVAVAVAILVAQGTFGPSVGVGNSAVAGTEEPFTLIMVPDTQYAVQNKPELYYAQMDWIRANRDTLNIPFVLHVGDIIEWPDSTPQWERARQGIGVLDDQVPYQIAIGNHDMDAWSSGGFEAIAADRSTTRFNTYFPLSLFEAMPVFGGNHPEGLSDNTFFLFRAGGVDWLAISLKYDPTPVELAWADQVVASHPDRLVIINSHNYQRGNGSQAQRTNVGNKIWDEVARKHSNVRFVFSGHFVTAGMRVDSGDNENSVYQIQADYQTSSTLFPIINENSYLRVMNVDPQQGTLDVQTFSPYCAERPLQLCPANKTDSNNQFTVTGIDFTP